MALMVDEKRLEDLAKNALWDIVCYSKELPYFEIKKLIGVLTEKLISECKKS